ncbi:hypothetical protein SRB5_01550 [Streptomyces sp. RB5]|uniref:PH domain-containing protein n=1 Tax=Streptomyces smaragdinus TaxID=2585196 RepID=A0A7K0C9C0_9ACTN|nr:hypothetical protein [Streptomyces smaragdinus]MQY10051.1 hypothetical protein [Streptomyces smaragdinus]
MSDAGGTPVAMWRIGGTIRTGVCLVAGIVGVRATVAWGAWAALPAWSSAQSAAVWTAVSVAVWLIAWFAFLRVRLEVRSDAIVIVNPWGRFRLERSDVASVSLGNWGAEFHHPDGFRTTAYALSDLAASGRRQDQRFAQVKSVVDVWLTRTA